MAGSEKTLGKTFYVRIISNNHLWILSALFAQVLLSSSQFFPPPNLYYFVTQFPWLFTSRCLPYSYYFHIYVYFQCKNLLLYLMKMDKATNFYLTARLISQALPSVQHLMSGRQAKSSKVQSSWPVFPPQYINKT